MKTAGTGIFCQRANTHAMSAVITLNAVHDNGGHGIYIQPIDTTLVLFNYLYFNTGYDFYNDTAYPDRCAIQLLGRRCTRRNG